MRDFFDAILAFIAAESLTDLEFGTMVSELPIYDQSTYDDLARVINSRGSIGTALDRLNMFYSAKGVTITQAAKPKTNILIGLPI